MEILVTNDDGIDSPGLWALAEAMSRIGPTTVVAPDSEQSGVGTSVSVRGYGDFPYEEVVSRVPGVPAYSVSGTPTDSVIVAMRYLSPDKRFDIVVSGINPGANCGRDVHYSGTVSATLQGHFRNIAAVAVSLVLRYRGEKPKWETAAVAAEHVVRHIEAGHLPVGPILNVNVPNLPIEEIRGVVTTRTATVSYNRMVKVPSKDGVGFTLQLRPADEAQHPEGTDIWAVNADMVSITPMTLDPTDHGLVVELAEPVRQLESDLLGDRSTG